MFNKAILNEMVNEIVKEENRKPKNLVQVKFNGGLRLSYLSDLPEIKVRDVVCVEGELKGQLAIVTKVLSSFKKPKYNMKWIINKIENDISGVYFKFEDLIVSLDSSLTAKKIMNILTAGQYKENPALGKDNVEIVLENLRKCELFNRHGIKYRGRKLFNNSAVKFIGVNDGNGKAIVQSSSGEDFYEIDFRYANGIITYIVCECPCFYACKHLYAFLLKFKELYVNFIKPRQIRNFIACEKECFGYMMRYAKGKMIIDL